MTCLFLRYLGPYVRACVFQSQAHSMLQELLDPTQSDQAKMEALYTTVPAELACLRTLKMEWDASLADLRASLQSFRRKWSAMSLGSSDARSQMLALLQPISEVHQVCLRSTCHIVLCACNLPNKSHSFRISHKSIFQLCLHLVAISVASMLEKSGSIFKADWFPGSGLCP